MVTVVLVRVSVPPGCKGPGWSARPGNECDAQGNPLCTAILLSSANSSVDTPRQWQHARTTRKVHCDADYGEATGLR